MMLKEKGKQKMRYPEILLFLVAVTLLIISPALANAPPPPTTLKIYFEKNNISVNESVTFTVNCSGKGLPSQYHLSAICPSYGCFLTENVFGDLGSATSCDLVGDLNGEQFSLLNIQNPISCTLDSNGWTTTMRSCDFRVNISSGNITTIKTQAMNITPKTTNRVVIMETPTVKPGGIEGIVANFICFLKNILGGTC